MLGHTGVGKSTLCVQLCKNFNQSNPYNTRNIYNITPTIGVQYNSLDVNFMDSRVKVNIWDTSGQARFDDINRSFYQKVAVAYLVYDCGRISTLDWVKQKHTELSQLDVSCIMVGNVFEYESDTVQKYALTFATKHNLPIFKVSALNGLNIHYPVVEAAKIACESTGRGGIVNIQTNGAVLATPHLHHKEDWATPHLHHKEDWATPNLHHKEDWATPHLHHKEDWATPHLHHNCPPGRLDDLDNRAPDSTITITNTITNTNEAQRTVIGHVTSNNLTSVKPTQKEKKCVPCKCVVL